MDNRCNRGYDCDGAQLIVREIIRSASKPRSSISEAVTRNADCSCNALEVLGVVLGRQITCPHGRFYVFQSIRTLGIGMHVWAIEFAWTLHRTEKTFDHAKVRTAISRSLDMESSYYTD